MGHVERPRCDVLALPTSRLVFNRVPPSSLGSETRQPCAHRYPHFAVGSRELTFSESFCLCAFQSMLPKTYF